MDLTLILAGGYWSVSKKLHEPVDIENSAEDRGVDYALRIKGLPAHFLPAEDKKVIKYHCTQCNSPVPEWEVEHKTGCFQNHKCRQEVTTEKEWPTFLYHPVKDELKKKKPVLADGMVLYVNQPNGYQIAQKIFKFVERSLPKGESMPKPVALGTKNGFIIDSVDDIPLVDITSPEVKQEALAEIGRQECPHCGKEISAGFKALRMHVMQSHKQIYEEKYRNKTDSELQEMVKQATTEQKAG